MTRRGTAYRLQPLAPITGETDYGLLHTDDGNQSCSPMSAKNAKCAASQSAEDANFTTGNVLVRDRILKLRMGGMCAKNHGVLLPTPRHSEWKGTGPLGSKSHIYRLERWYLDAVMQEVEWGTGKLNPDYLDWLMGNPIGWSALRPLATDGFPRWQQSLWRAVRSFWAPADVTDDTEPDNEEVAT